MQLERYEIQDEALAGRVAFLWHLHSQKPVEEGRLLPVLNTDLLFSLGAPLCYREEEGDWREAPAVHLRNVKSRPQWVRQEAGADVWGVSLYLWGAGPLLGLAMPQVAGQVVDLAPLLPDFCAAALEGLRGGGGAPALAAAPLALETALLGLPGAGIKPAREDLVRAFVQEMEGISIGAFCRRQGVGLKRLERAVKGQTGLTPKQVQQVGRFQKAGNALLYASAPPALADVAYDHDYTDQTHFTKDFGAYAGVTPFQFLQKEDSVKGRLKGPK